MRINWRIVQEQRLDEYSIPTCPNLFRTQAERIVELIARTPFPTYTKMGQFDMMLILAYWGQNDGLAQVVKSGDVAEFQKWFTHQATNPELIRRARQWLVEHNYLIPTQSVENRAQEAGERWRQEVKG